MAPQLAYLPLSAYVPHGEAHMLDGAHRLHVEPYGGYGGDRLVQLQFVEKCRLASAVQSEKQDLGMLSAGKGFVEVLEFRH